MTIKPFQGIRPDQKYATLLNVPPYDVVSLNQVKKAVQDNPYSFFHITRSEADLINPGNEYSPVVYSRARENFKSFIEKKFLIKDTKEFLYLLSQTWNDETQIGLYAAVSCKEYADNLIKKHENTRNDKEADRTKHIKTVKADTGPVLLAFEDKIDEKGSYFSIIKHIFEKQPVYDFIDENNVENKLWVVKAGHDIKKLQDYFQNIKAFYIADGHHRAASAVNVWKDEQKDGINNSDYFMSVIFPASQLKISPYNRMVADLNGYSPEELLTKIKENFTITRAAALTPGRKGIIGMYLDKSSYHLKLKDEFIKDDLLESLDVSVLQKFILGPVFGIDDPRTSERLIFTGGNPGPEYLVNKVNNAEAMAAFSLFPVNINDLIKITESSRLMPPKSTWFEPKLRDGLVVYSLE
jgi:uncharacterized protein (DUF1015 family)